MYHSKLETSTNQMFSLLNWPSISLLSNCVSVSIHNLKIGLFNVVGFDDVGCCWMNTCRCDPPYKNKSYPQSVFRGVWGHSETLWRPSFKGLNCFQNPLETRREPEVWNANGNPLETDLSTWWFWHIIQQHCDIFGILWLVFHW